MTIRGLQRLLLMLGAKVGYEYRKLVEGTFTRVMAGDESLIQVINANAASDAPLQQACRSALAQEPVAPVLDDLCLAKKREREELMLDLDVSERRLALEERKLRLQETRREKLMDHASTALDLIDSIKDRANIDERTKLQFEDHIKNVILTSTPSQPPAANSNGAAAAVNETTPLNVSILAAEMGFKCADREVIVMGRAMAAKYRETYQREPSKHKQYVKGNYIPVNSYMERDRAMMEKVIRDVIQKRATAANDTESDGGV